MQSSVSRPGWGSLCACVLGLALLAPVSLRAQPTAPDSLTLRHVGLRLAEHDPLRIVAFGSSSTQGIGASSPAASYPGQLQIELTRLLHAREPIIVLNRGIGGEDADDMSKRLASVIAEHPDLIIWQTGSNDPLRGVPVDRFIAETIAGIEQIRAAHIDVMLMEPQLCRKLADKKDSPAYREALHTIGAQMGVPVIRRYDIMEAWLAERALTPAQMLSPDGLHMADGGYAKLADAVAQDILHRAEFQHTATDTSASHGSDISRTSAVR
jgi:acyl-CoA thioesterase I